MTKNDPGIMTLKGTGYNEDSLTVAPGWEQYAQNSQLTVQQVRMIHNFLVGVEE